MTNSLTQKAICSVLLLLFLVYPSLLYSMYRQTVVHALPESAWPPFYIIEEENRGTVQGFFIDIVNSVLVEELGLSVEQHAVPWTRAQAEVEMGVADFMIGVTSDERAAYTESVATPIHQMYLHLFTYKGHPRLKEMAEISTVADIKDLGLTLAADRGDGWYKSNVAGTGVTTHYINSDERLPKFLAARRADGAIEASVPMNYFMKELGLQSELVMTNVKFGPVNFRLLVSQKSPLIERLDDIDRAIKKISKNGVMDDIVKKYTVF